MAGAKILVVEDEAIVATDIERRLTRLGYVVVGTAESAGEALALAEQHRPDLALMDIHLKGLSDGIGAAETMRERWFIPVIYLTAYADDATLSRARVTEPFGYVIKPFEERELQTTIEMALYKHQSEKRLRESERRYAATLSSIGDAVAATDGEGRVTFLNGVAQQLTEWTDVEAHGQPLTQVLRIISEEDRSPVENPVVRVLRDGVVVGLANHSLLVTRTGKEFPIDDCAAPILDDHGSCIGAVLVFRDVSQSRKLEEQLEQAKRMESIGQLAGGIAHDFNNLLTVINGFSNLLLTSIDEQHPWRVMVQEINRAGDRAAHLTRQLLAFGRKQTLQPRRVHLNAVITAMEKILSRLIGAGLRIDLDLDPELGMVMCDPHQVEHVLMNLAANARDAMGGQGVLTLSTQRFHLAAGEAAPIHDMPPGNYSCLHVTDTGSGIPDHVMPRIFEPFFTTKQVGQGTGMGLATVYGIVSQSGAFIAVSTKAGKGTRFSIYFPTCSEEAVQLCPDERLITDWPGGDETILVVEDEDSVRFFTSKILSLSGYRVLEARNGQEALELLERREEPIDLLLTDLVMPEMGGIELAIRMRQMGMTFHALFMSGYSDPPTHQDRSPLNDSNFLPKPFPPDALANKIRSVLAGPEF